MTLPMSGKIACFAAALTLGVFSSGALAQTDKPESDKRTVETIEVTGQKTIAQLKKTFDKQRFEFLDLYNTINEVAKYDMLCSWRRPVHTRIAQKSCEPRYLKDFRAMAIRMSQTGPGIDLNRLPSDDHIKFLTRLQREDAFEHVAALVATHPELYESFSKLDALHQHIEERKEQARNGE
jgi:hypothetical protein